MKTKVTAKMKVCKRAFKSVLMLVLQLGTTPAAFASIPPSLRPNNQTPAPKLVLQRGFDFSKGFDLAAIQPVESLAAPSSNDIARIIPSNMAPTTDGGMVATQILDHSISTWFNSDSVRNSSLGRTAHQIEKTMENDISFGGSKPESIKHSLKFSMKATQTRADVEYTGLTNAQITYFIAQEKTNFELREPVRALGTQVVYNNIATRDERRQTVSLRWDW